MNRPKKFDCVRMKNEIQARLQDEEKDLSPEDRRRQSGQRIANDPILGPLWKRKNTHEQSEAA